MVFRFEKQQRVSEAISMKCDWCEETSSIWRILVLKDFIEGGRGNFFHEECFIKCKQHCIQEGLLW